MSSFLNESPLIQNTNTININEENAVLEDAKMTRKIEFDKGNPLNMDFPLNKVYTIPYTITGFFKFISKKTLTMPFNICIIIISLFYLLCFLFQMKDISHLNLHYSIFFHLIVLIIEILFSCFQYIKIYLNDMKINNQKARVYDNEKKKFIEKPWKKIQVGNIICVKKDEVVPADMIILESLDHNHQCYLDYSSLNGIFDSFVIKKACNDTHAPVMKKILFSEYVKNIKGFLKYEEPNSNIHIFNGRLKLESFPRASDIKDDNFVMRGSTIKNIPLIYGLVVYTGMETKIMMTLKFTISQKNNLSNYDTHHSIKNQFSNVIIKKDCEVIRVTLKFIQYILIGVYFCLVLMAFIIELHKSFLCYYSFKSPLGDDHYYLHFSNVEQENTKQTNPFYEMFLSTVTFFLTFHFILPFDWFGLMEIGYYIFKLFITWDEKVLLNKYNKVEIINAGSLPNFGQVKHILTDKTGTLTSRKFKLKVCSIHGKIYSFDNKDKKDENYIFRISENNNVKNYDIYQELHSNRAYTNEIKDFLEELCLCHSVKLINEKINNINQNKNNDEMELQDLGENKYENINKTNSRSTYRNNKTFGSTYAEEKAMLKTLSQIGYKICKTKKNFITIDIEGEKKIYGILGLNKYTEERKRMSILIYNEKESGSTLLCKANDSSIFKLIRKTNAKSENEIEKTIYQIKQLSKFGYRYYIYSKKYLNEEETNNFLEKYKTAENYVVKSEEHLRNLAIEYERDLILIGVLFFEEEISPDLKYSISKLNNAGIKVWIASGDKRENVISVGTNLKLYNPDSIKGDFSDKDKPEDLDIKMSMLLMQFLFPNDKINKMKTRKGISVESHIIKKSSKDLTILISGNCFNKICNDQRNFQSLATLLSYCTCLLAYQFTPNDKFQLCQMIKMYCCKNSKVLSVGDGFNDFTMLKEADLSIGIRSREILQVRNTCDIIVTQFSQIVDLILVHGTWNFWKIRFIANLSFYSNFIITIPIFLHQNTNEIGSSFYIETYGKFALDILVINLFVIFTFSFDVPVERTLISLNINVYKSNFYNKKIIMFEFGLELIRALSDSIVLYFVIYKLNNVFDKDGFTAHSENFCNAIVYISFSIVIFKVYTLRLNTINIIHIFIGIITVILLFVISYVNKDTQISIIEGFKFPPYFFSGLIIIGITYLYEFAGRCIVTFFGSEDFLLKLTRMFIDLIHNNAFFKNFNSMYVTIAKEMPNVINRIDKISFPEVLEKIFNHNNTLDPALENMADVSNEEVAKLKLRKPFLCFNDMKVEMDYIKYLNKHFKKSFIAYLLCILFFLIIDVLIVGSKNLKLTIYLKITYLIVGLILLIPYLFQYFNKIFPIYLFIILTIEIICIYVQKKDNDTKLFIDTIILLTFPLYFSPQPFSQTILLTIYYLLSITPSIYLNDFDFKEKTNNKYYLYSNLPLIYHNQIYIYSIIFTMILFSYNNKLMSRIEFLKYYKSALELRKDNLIMANLIPDFVRTKFIRRERGAVYGYQVVSIVFCDLSDFDSLVSKLTPKDLITFLDELYSVMDQFCQLHGLQKIETVGKTYMAAGGIKECEIDFDPVTLSSHHAVRCFEFSLDILDLVMKMVLTSGDKIKVKIGIHTGKVIPAVVGEHKPQFSLIGDTVNTTARMCTNSRDNCVNCSEFSYEEIKQKYKEFEQRTKEVKGKGMMNLYLYDPMKHKKGIIDSKMKKDIYGNMVMRSITKNVPVIMRQGTKGSRRDSKSVLKNFDNLSNRRNSLESSIFIVENSQDLIMNTNNNFIGDNQEDYLNYNYHYDERKKYHNNEKRVEDDVVKKNSFFNNSLFFYKFRDPVSENGFIRFEKILFQHSEIKSILVNVTFIGSSIFGIFMLSQYAIKEDDPIYLFIIINGIILIILVGVVYETHRLIRNFTEIFPFMIMLIYFGLTLVVQIAFNKINEKYFTTLLTEQLLIITSLGSCGLLNYFQLSYNYVLYIIIFLINTCINHKEFLIKKYSIFFIFLCVMKQILICISYYDSTMNFLTNQEESKALVEKEKMLFNLMPLHVVQNMKDDIPVADVLPTVTLLFADIVRYTDFGNCHQPVEVVHMLMELFKRFDDATKECHVYKVHTIGDCYVVMGFNGKVSMNMRNYYEEAKNVCKMGECMIKIIREVRKKVNFEALDMRIGIHTGAVIAGIIGSTVVRYDIFGSDVLIANKMESSGVPGRINISEDTKKLLESQTLPYNLSFNKVVPVQGAGKEIKCFLIEKDNER